MTEEDKQKERAMKAGIGERLAEGMSRIEAWRGELDATDERLMRYIGGVAGNPDGHNLYECLAVLRFAGFMGRYTWNRGRVRKFFAFYEALRFNGTRGRQRYRLTPVQAFQFASIFGFSDSEGRRLTRTAYIFVPRKFSKTTSAASLAVWDMLFGDNNAQAYVGANSYAQAKICFDEIRAIMRDIDPGERHIKINREKITFKDRGRDSMINCLTANARTQDGLSASLVIMDEYAQARNTATKNGADLKNVLVSSMGTRREPLLVVITTASEVVDGPFAHELEEVKSVLRGEAENDSMFAAIFQPDVDDREDDPAVWSKVQPHLGITVQRGFYEWQWREAQLSAENMLAFRTKLLNIFTVNTDQAWLSYAQAQAIVREWDIDRIEGHPYCAVAFDLSVHDDFSAVSYTVYSERRKHFYTHTDYYFPEGALPGHPNEQLYRAWHANGHLRLCRGKRIDVEMIAEDILRRSERLNIVRIGYDGWKAQDLVNILSSVGARGVLTPYSQTHGSFNLPVESFEMLAYDEPPRITLNGNPINLFCLSNCVLVEDSNGNKKPMKSARYRKIDGVITMLMTLGLLYSYER